MLNVANSNVANSQLALGIGNIGNTGNISTLPYFYIPHSLFPIPYSPFISGSS